MSRKQQWNSFFFTRKHTLASRNNFVEQSYEYKGSKNKKVYHNKTLWILNILDGYPPIANSCIEFYKLGIVPTISTCLNLSDSSGGTLTCCWNSMDNITVSYAMFHKIEPESVISQVEKNIDSQPFIVGNPITEI